MENNSTTTSYKLENGNENENNKKFITSNQQRRSVPLGVVLLIFISVTSGFVGGWVGSQKSNQLTIDKGVNQQIITSEGQLYANLAREVGPSVVSVNVTSSVNRGGFFDFEPSRIQSAGTGFIISEDGLVVTNRHVVESSNDITITLSDGTELENVEKVGQTNSGDPLDIAFLRVKDKKGKELKPVKIGDSSKMTVGDKVLAIGNALGQFQNTVTTGIISGYGRNVEAASESGMSAETLQNLFQTDAAINQGNSGGPLVNMNGEVIGINTAIAGNGAQNIGFAIPINDVKSMIDSVIQTGKLERPLLGVRYILLDDNIAKELGLSTKQGAYIVPSRNRQQSIVPGSSAAKANLKEGDIITKIDGNVIDEKTSLSSIINKHRVGDRISITYIRGDKEHTVDVKLESAQD